MFAFAAFLRKLKAYVRSANFLNTIRIALHPVIMHNTSLSFNHVL